MCVQVIRGLRLESSKVPQDYDVNFKKAEWTFLYQLVFDPRTQQQVRLNSLPEDVDPREIEFAGTYPTCDLCSNLAVSTVCKPARLVY